ncbi:MAG: helix-turn-helix domain-containing protein [Terracidiphilus sp.]
MRIQPVRTEADHDAAVARITQLMGAEPGSEASDELEILVTLVDAYEAKHFPTAAPDPVAVIKFQMEQQGLSRKDLEPMIGSRARVSEILTGKRALTLPMIRRLHHGLCIPVDLLVGPAMAHARTARQNKRKPSQAVSRAHRGTAAQQSAR